MMRRKKLVFPRKFKIHWAGMSANRTTTLLEVSYALKLFIQPFIYIQSNHECAILFSIYYECTNAFNTGSSPLVLFVKGI